MTKPSIEGLPINSTIGSPLFDIPGGTIPLGLHVLFINVTDASGIFPFVLTSIRYSTTPTPRKPSNFTSSASASYTTIASYSTHNDQPTSSPTSLSSSKTRVLLEIVIGASAGAVALLCILAYVYLRYRRRISLSCSSQRAQRNSAGKIYQLSCLATRCSDRLLVITPSQLHDQSTGYTANTTSNGYRPASTFQRSIDKSKAIYGSSHQHSFASGSLPIEVNIAPTPNDHTESVNTELRFQPSSLPRDPRVGTSDDPSQLIEDIGTIPISHWRDLEDEISVIGM